MVNKTVKTTALNFDLNEFKKQQEQVKQYATQQVAAHVDTIKDLLKEIKNLAELGKVDIQLGGAYGKLSDLIEEVDSANPNWNSSSYDC